MAYRAWEKNVSMVTASDDAEGLLSSSARRTSLWRIGSHPRIRVGGQGLVIGSTLVEDVVDYPSKRAGEPRA